MAKTKKVRSENYEKKLIVKEGTTFEDLINASLGLNKSKDKPKKKEKKG